MGDFRKKYPTDWFWGKKKYSKEIPGLKKISLVGNNPVKTLTLLYSEWQGKKNTSPEVWETKNLTQTTPHPLKVKWLTPNYITVNLPGDADNIFSTVPDGSFMQTIYVLDTTRTVISYNEYY